MLLLKDGSLPWSGVLWDQTTIQIGRHQSGWIRQDGRWQGFPYRAQQHPVPGHGAHTGSVVETEKILRVQVLESSSPQKSMTSWIVNQFVPLILRLLATLSNGPRVSL